jgi:hypothetical protein
MREPTIFWAPGSIKPGIVTDLGTTMDLFTTLSNLAGVPIPDDREMDGVDLGPVLFDDYGVFTHPQLCFAHYYDSASEKQGIRHQEHGVLFRTTMLLPDQEPIDIDEQDSVLINAFIDAFDFKQLHIESGGSVSVVVSNIGSQMRFLGDLVYRVNNLAREEDGAPVYEATRVVSSIDSQSAKPALITRSMIEHAIHLLNRRVMVMFKMGIGEPEQQEKTLKSLARKG